MPPPQAERNASDGGGATAAPPGRPGAPGTAPPFGQRPVAPRPVAQLPPNQLGPGFANRALPQSTLDAFARFAAAEAASLQPPSRKQLKKRKRRATGRVLAVMLLLGGAGAGVMHYRSRLFGQDAPAHPDHWDARVTSIVAFVEQTRELRFTHPIYIDFLAEPDFVALFDEPASQGADAAPQEVARQASALFNAQGLAVGYDPTAGEQAVSAVTTLGFYSPEDDRMFVRGDVLTPAVRATLAHELTHALQDQHFTLTLGGDNDLELRAVVEADAMRIGDAYTATMTPEEQAAATADNTLAPDAVAALDTVPPSVVETRYAPYELGPVLLDQVIAAQGNAGVDRLIENPPKELLLLDPDLYGQPLVDDAIDVPVPEGATVLEPSARFSPLRLLLMLDAWLPWDMSRTAIDGWTGSGYTSYERADGTVCFAVVARVGAATEPLTTALTWWSAAAGSAAVPVAESDRVSFTACDRGPGAAAPPAPELSTLASLQFEHDYVQQSLSVAIAAGNVDSARVQVVATCEARALASDPSTVPLLGFDSYTAEQTQLITAVMTAADARCVAPPGG